MTTVQKVIKYLAMAFAIFLAICIVVGIMEAAFGIFGGIFTGDSINETAVSEDTEIYELTSDIRILELEINAADLVIKEGESFSVESNLKHLKVEDSKGVLKINETQRIGVSYNDAVLTLCIPADKVFDRVNIKTGAGRFAAEKLSAGTLRLELGAGDVYFGDLVAKSAADISGGVGRITVDGGALHNLDIEMGVGELKLCSALSGESEFDLGVGETNITIIGSRDDYSLDVDKGLGSITVDGESVSALDEYGKGNDFIEINGGIGSINVVFEAERAQQ